MKRIVLFFLCVLPLLSASDLDRDGDFQVWYFTKVSKGICENVRVSLQPEIRFGDGGNAFYLWYLQGFVHVDSRPWLTLSAGYRQQYRRTTGASQWFPVYSPMVQATLHFPFKQVRLELRNRVEYVFPDTTAPSFWGVRQRYRVAWPIDIGGVIIEPDLWDEFFIRQREGFSQNRLGIGLAIPANRWLTLTGHYILRYVEIRDSWRRHNVLSFSARMSF